MTQRSPFERIRDAVETKTGKVSVATLIVLGGLGLAGCAQDVEAKPSNTPTSEQTSTPTPEVTPSASPEFTVESLEIKTGLDTETLGKTLIEDRFTEWLNAGANQQTMNAWLSFNGTIDQFLPTIINPITDTFSEALFVPDHANSPLDSDLESNINGRAKANKATVDWYITTVHSDNPENIEPYRQWLTVDSTKELPSEIAGSRILLINYTEHSNADKNTANPLVTTLGTFKITLQDINGVEKIASFEVNSR